MKLAVTNLAWAVHDDEAALAALRAHGVQGIEVAPTKVWPEWRGATPKSARAYREAMLERGFALPALQAILFGQPSLRLFATEPHEREAWLSHIARVAELAQALGASSLVYGAPASRKRGALAASDAFEQAAAQFARAAAICAEHDTCLCIEPISRASGCDFVVDAAEAIALVAHVDTPGFGLHLDAAAMVLSGDRAEQTLLQYGDRLRHYHISEPDLSGFHQPRAPHALWLHALRESGYDRWVSVEVLYGRHDLAHTLRFARSVVDAAG